MGNSVLTLWVNQQKKSKSLIDEDGEVGELGEEFFANAKRGRPPMPENETKQPVTLYLDRDIISYFKLGGRGWQTRINAALRGYIISKDEAGEL